MDPPAIERHVAQSSEQRCTNLQKYRRKRVNESICHTEIFIERRRWEIMATGEAGGEGVAAGRSSEPGRGGFSHVSTTTTYNMINCGQVIQISGHNATVILPENRVGVLQGNVGNFQAPSSTHPHPSHPPHPPHPPTAATTAVVNTLTEEIRYAAGTSLTFSPPTLFSSHRPSPFSLSFPPLSPYASLFLSPSPPLTFLLPPPLLSSSSPLLLLLKAPQNPWSC